MLIKYALILSIIFQFAAAIIVITLIRSTKYNSSWIFLSIALFLMAIRRLLEYFPLVDKELTPQVILFSSWIGILISILMLVGMFYVRKSLKYLFKLEEARAMADKKLIAAIIQTEENERRRLARELHDGLGPLLSSVKMAASAVSSSERPSNHQEILKNMLTTIDESIHTLREISNNLSPQILENFGLTSAIRSFITKLEQTGKISIEFRTNTIDKRYPPDVEIIVYRTITELIHNTLRHANAERIMISLDEEDGFIRLLYQDDGKGFDKELIVQEKTDGMGLRNIRSRINSLNGKFNIDSWPGEGIIVTVEVPVNGKSNNS